MPLSCEELRQRLDLMRDADPQLAQRGMGFSHESDILNLIESLNAHHVVLSAALLEIGRKVPGCMGATTRNSLLNLLAKG